MNIRYSTFFNIELLHEYYHALVCNDLEIVPSSYTQIVAKNLGLQWRLFDNRLIALLRVNDQNEPFVNTPSTKNYLRHYGQTVFRFYLRLKNANFQNFANINLSGASSKNIFYFSNLSGNERSAKLFLTKPLANAAKDREYIPGDLVLDPLSGEVFEALEKQKLSDENISGQPENWSKKNNSFSYLTSNDLIEFSNGDYYFRLNKPMKKMRVDVFKFNPENEKFDLPVNASLEKVSEEKQAGIHISLASFNAGLYKILVNDEIRYCFYDPSPEAQNAFGVIEIFSHHLAPDPFALVDHTEKLLAPNYSICFANRKVLWRYIRKDDRPEKITDIGETKYGFKLIGNEFISSSPIALSENTCKTLQLDFSSRDYRMFPLPNPRIDRLGRYRLYDYDYLCSDIFLNY